LHGAFEDVRSIGGNGQLFIVLIDGELLCGDGDLGIAGVEEMIEDPALDAGAGIDELAADADGDGAIGGIMGEIGEKDALDAVVVDEAEEEVARDDLDGRDLGDAEVGAELFAADGDDFEGGGFGELGVEDEIEVGGGDLLLLVEIDGQDGDASDGDAIGILVVTGDDGLDDVIDHSGGGGASGQEEED